MKNNRFLKILRQLTDMENRTGKDYSEQVKELAYARVAALENEGVDPDVALSLVQNALSNERLRFPVTLEPLAG